MNVALEAGVAVYVAMAVTLAVWLGIFAYLWRIDAQARELKRLVEREERNQPTSAPQSKVTRMRAGESLEK